MAKDPLLIHSQQSIVIGQRRLTSTIDYQLFTELGGESLHPPDYLLPCSAIVSYEAVFLKGLLGRGLKDSFKFKPLVVQEGVKTKSTNYGMTEDSMPVHCTQTGIQVDRGCLKPGGGDKKGKSSCWSPPYCSSPFFFRFIDRKIRGSAYDFKPKSLFPPIFQRTDNCKSVSPCFIANYKRVINL